MREEETGICVSLSVHMFDRGWSVHAFAYIFAYITWILSVCESESEGESEIESEGESERDTHLCVSCLCLSTCYVLTHGRM